MTEHIVTYRVEYTCKVKSEASNDIIEDLQNFEDAVSDIDIPEGGRNKSKYRAKSFEVVGVEEVK